MVQYLRTTFHHVALHCDHAPARCSVCCETRASRLWRPGESGQMARSAEPAAWRAAAARPPRERGRCPPGPGVARASRRRQPAAPQTNVSVSRPRRGLRAKAPRRGGGPSGRIGPTLDRISTTSQRSSGIGGAWLLPAPDKYPTPPHGAHPMQRDAMHDAVDSNDIEEEVSTLGEGHPLQRHADKRFLNAVIISKLEARLPEVAIPANAVQQILDRHHSAPGVSRNPPSCAHYG